MNTPEEKLVMSKQRVNTAVDNIFRQNPDFTGQFNLEIHCRDGTVRDVYEVKSRRKLL